MVYKQINNAGEFYIEMKGNNTGKLSRLRGDSLKLPIGSILQVPEELPQLGKMTASTRVSFRCDINPRRIGGGISGLLLSELLAISQVIFRNTV